MTNDFASFDRRGYPTVGVRDGYRGWAPTYDDTVLDLMDLALLERLDSVPWPAVARAADLGCGTGRTGAWLRARGVGAIDGVDLTPEMLAAARARGAHDSLAVADVAETGLADRAYDLVACCLVDEHLPDLGPAYREAARLLAEDGRFVVVGYHPFFIMATGMPTHFADPERGPVAIRTHVHLLSDHVAAARAAGLAPIELHEAVVDDAWVAAKPSWAPRRGWPISFAWSFRPARG